MKKIILSVLITLAIIILGSVLYIYSGSYNISQLSHHNRLTRWAIENTTSHSIKRRIKDITVPDLSDSAQIITGFVHYNEMCIGCHGGPGIGQAEMAEGLYPSPPKLTKFSSKMDPKEAFWVIKNGIKMTSMPAFGPTHSDNKIWAIVAFLNQSLDKMSPETYTEWIDKYAENEEDDSTATSESD